MLQTNDQNLLHLIYAVSRPISETDKMYHSSKLELLAIVWSVDRLRQFLIGIKFLIFTDCQALVHINTMRTKNAQIIRWLGLLAEYDFDIFYKKGEQMRHIDALSRAPVEPAENNLLEEATIYVVSTHEDEILMNQ